MPSKKRTILGDKKKKCTEYGFTRCAVYRKDRVYILSFLEELENEREHVTKVLRWSGSWNHWIVPWAIVGLCVLDRPELEIISMGLGGRIDVRASSGQSEEQVDASSEGPPYRGMLRDIQLIGAHVYATGMGRQVYKRTEKGRWMRSDQQVVAPKGQSKGLGFNSIDGFSEDDIYAVGWHGEIWHYDGRTWRKIDSPTNLILERVICAPSSTVYVCGQNGVVLRGRGMQFETIKQTTVEDDFWGMEWFEGKLWLATHESLFTLNEDELIPVDMGVGEPLTCGWLHANDGVIWSVGPEDLAFYDGKTWSEVILT